MHGLKSEGGQIIKSARNEAQSADGVGYGEGVPPSLSGEGSEKGPCPSPFFSMFELKIEIFVHSGS